MKQTLKDFSNFLLVVLCEYVLGDAEYLLLGEPGHVALSNSSVSVAFQYVDGVNGTLRNVSVLLVEASTNRTVATKHLLTSQAQGTLEFECFHFKEAGDYWFTMSPDAMASRPPAPWGEKSAFLQVEWPVFHVDLNRTSQAAGGALRVGLFTPQPLCPFPGDSPSVEVDVTVRGSLPGASAQQGRPLETRRSQRTALAQSQWVEVACAPVGPAASVTVVLRLLGRGSVITAAGPIDLSQKFGYRLVTARELWCESAVEVEVVPPPCVAVQGAVAVFKEAPRRPGEKPMWLAESSLRPGERTAIFNCTLFDVGKNKYCFDFSISSRSHFSAKEKECMLIQRNIETWGPWQPWSQCSATCGDGVRERGRVCLTSFPSRPGCPGVSSETSPCSLEECAAFRPASPTPPQPQGPTASNNVVTVTGISLCLSIITATLLVTLWRKLGRAPRCGAPSRGGSLHTPGCRKNSDEENICDLGEPCASPSEAGDGPSVGTGTPGIPLTCRRNGMAAPEEDASGSETFQASAQKILPPLFSYRLAQQQLKEMKKKGLTETTKVYHVSQSPLTDTAVDAASRPPLDLESPEDAPANKFRIKSPFPDLPAGSTGERPPSRLAVSASPVSCALSPSQALLRKSQTRPGGSRGGQPERGHPRPSHFRRTASFHEAKQARPFRERSMSTLTPRQVPAYSSRPRACDQAEDCPRPQSRGACLLPEELERFQGVGDASAPLRPPAKPHTLGQPGSKAGSRDRQAGLVAGAERTEPQRGRRGPSPSHRSVSRKHPSPVSPKEKYQRVSPLSPSQGRRDKCQSFPAHPEFAFYDNSSFGLTEAEQRMLDLPGYFGSNEEDETTSTLSVEKLVI
ncbi:thrombospondin type-1 domain-containing protein 1 isoform X2 [Dasypus novemcinctus]|uniref:thrombospondin type-1 domain-containing protein 1 isoform X2 n=1 Tax=Dasypus novemcinctus TaxID=9361 RepID=UPI00265E3E44|nr:thrombospondin type-1 domain-containing protein 1 isoform X2 [Dasypus novemcinctus]